MIKIFLLLSLLFLCSFATELQRNYFVKNHYVLLSDIIPDAKKDTILLTMQPNKHIVRIKESKLHKLLHSYGYKGFIHQYSYIQFTQQSPIDTKNIQEAIYKFYTKAYTHITIQSIHINTRTYIKELPKRFTIQFPKKAQLSNNFIFFIQTAKKRKIFFNATIQANILVYTARQKIHKDEELSVVNTKKKSIMLKKFFAMPLQDIKAGLYQAKHTLHTNKIITKRDIVALMVVHRGATVSVILKNNGIWINFSAKALQNGRLNEIIKVKNENGKTIRVRVRGHNIAEVI